MPQQPEAIVTAFYACFQQRNPDGMVACYHPEITFHDPVFQTLRGPAAGAMWHMLLEGNSSLTITFDHVTFNGEQGSAHWEADYVFSQTGRKVHNNVNAHFRIVDDKIIEHRDEFDLWRWANMALGGSGKWLGWSPPVQAAIRRQAQERLRRYIARAK
jgi:limonene-1,2-epoxide hydrolase